MSITVVSQECEAHEAELGLSSPLLRLTSHESGARKRNKLGFLSLPVELRLQIYSHLIVPDGMKTRDIWIESMTSNILPGTSVERPHLALSQTCRRIHDEFIEHFHRLSTFAIVMAPLDAYVKFSTPPRFADRFLRLSSMRRVRLLILLPDIGAGHYIDVHELTSKLASLQSLSVAFTFPKRMYIHKGNAHLWAKSATLQGMMSDVIQSVPEHVLLSWWDETESPSRRDFGYTRYSGYEYVPIEVLQKLGQMYEPLRGQATRQLRVANGEV